MKPIALFLLGAPAIAAAQDPNIAAWCEALEESTVEIRGSLDLLGAAENADIQRAGTGFWSHAHRGAVITSAFVVERMAAIEVCTVGSDEPVCHQVTRVATTENPDVALLLTEAKPPGKHRFKTVEGVVDQPSALGGIDVQGGFVCGGGSLGSGDPPTVTQTLDARPLGGAPAILYTGKKKPGRMTVAGLLTGSGPLGAEATHPIQAIGSVPKDPDWLEPAAWRAARPWSPESRSIRVSANRPVWIVSDVPSLQDLRITRDNLDVCVGLYRLNGSLDESIAGTPERIATTCAEGELLYTTPTDERIGVAVWTSGAETQTTALQIAWR